MPLPLEPSDEALVDFMTDLIALFRKHKLAIAPRMVEGRYQVIPFTASVLRALGAANFYREEKH